MLITLTATQSHFVRSILTNELLKKSRGAESPDRCRHGVQTKIRCKHKFGFVGESESKH